MEIVINIPEETYNEVCWRGLHLCPRDNEELVNAIKNGIQLPRRHGDLIDRGMLPTNYITNDDIADASVIIGADKAESEE